jgi:hypothetical protein
MRLGRGGFEELVTLGVGASISLECVLV